MRTPYRVWIDHAGDSRYINCETLEGAIEAAKLVTPRRHQDVQIIGDGYDVSIDPDGRADIWDGLTDAERERVEEALGA